MRSPSQNGSGRNLMQLGLTSIASISSRPTAVRNFNGWGSIKQRPGRPGDQLAKTAEGIFGVPRISMPFVAEGGALIADGQGTLIASRSCLLNPNRNPTHVT